jgi:hypothetical protein
MAFNSSQKQPLMIPSEIPGQKKIPLVRVQINTQLINPNGTPKGMIQGVPSAVYVALFPTEALQRRSSSCMPSIREGIEMAVLTHVSPLYQHCQLLFCWENGDGSSLFTTFNTTKVLPSEFIPSIYRRSGWQSYALLVGPDIRATIFELCISHQGREFNSCAYHWNFLPCVPNFCAYNARGESFFCAEQVSFILKTAGIQEFTDMVPHLSTPDDIYYRVENMCRRSAASVADLYITFQNSNSIIASSSSNNPSRSGYTRDSMTPQAQTLMHNLGHDEGTSSSPMRSIPTGTYEKAANWNQWGRVDQKK